MGKEGEESVGRLSKTAALMKQSHEKENQGDMKRTKERERRPLKFPALIDECIGMDGRLEGRGKREEVGFFPKREPRELCQNLGWVLARRSILVPAREGARVEQSCT